MFRLKISPPPPPPPPPPPIPKVFFVSSLCVSLLSQALSVVNLFIFPHFLPHFKTLFLACFSLPPSVFAHCLCLSFRFTVASSLYCDQTFSFLTVYRFLSAIILFKISNSKARSFFLIK